MPISDYEKRKQLQDDRRREWAQNNVPYQRIMRGRIAANVARTANKEESYAQWRNSLKAAQNKIDEIQRDTSSVRSVFKGKKGTMPLRAAKLGFEFKKRIKELDTTPFKFLFIIAIFSDLGDFTWIIGFSLKVILFIALLGHGAWKKKLGARIIYWLLIVLDIIPFLGALPLSTIAVLLIWRDVKKEIKENEEKIKKIEKNPEEFWDAEYDEDEEMDEVT